MTKTEFNELDEIYKSLYPSVLENCNKFLKGFELDIYLDENYDFGRKRWVAVYENHSVFNGTIEIGVNKKLLYNFIVNNSIYYEEEMEAQLYVSFYHEIGHALFQLYRENSKYIKLPKGMERELFCSARKEEKVVEEFGRYMANINGNIDTGVENSKLYTLILSIRALERQAA